MSASRLVVAALVSLAVVACSGEQEEVVADAGKGSTPDAPAAAQATTDSSGLSFSVTSDKARRGEPTFTEGKGGEAWMSTTDGTLRMGIRHDSILLAFSDSLRHAVMTEVDTSMKNDVSKEDGALGKAIGGIVQGTVKAALSEVFDKERGFPIADVRSVKYEGGEIVFDYKKKPTFRPETIKNDDAPMTKRFHPADAARFVGAVRARLNGAS